MSDTDDLLVKDILKCQIEDAAVRRSIECAISGSIYLTAAGKYEGSSDCLDRMSILSLMQKATL